MNVRLQAEPVEVLLADLRATAVHDHRAQPGVPRETRFWAKAARSGSSVMALPPYLITTIRSSNRISHGSASIRVAAFSAARSA